MTLPLQEGLTFGKIHDNDAVADPEMGMEEAGNLMLIVPEDGESG